MSGLLFGLPFDGLSRLLSIAICANMAARSALSALLVSVVLKKSVPPYQQANRQQVMRYQIFRLTVSLLLVAVFAGAPVVFVAAAENNNANDDVKIIQGKDRTVYEYRVNGHLRAIKVVPHKGRTYFLVPADPTKATTDLDQAGRLVPSWHIVEF